MVKAALKHAREIEQGDVLHGFLLQAFAGADDLRRNVPKTITYSPLDGGSLPASEQLAVLTRVRSASVLVVANSCDIDGGGAITVVPIEPLSNDKWDIVRKRATSGNWAKSFYLGPSKVMGLESRSEAKLPQLVTVEPGFAETLMKHGLTRPGGLNDDGLQHLRWALGYCFGRNSRNDMAWQTDEDLRFHLESLEATPAAKRDQDEYDQVQAEIQHRGLKAGSKAS